MISSIQIITGCHFPITRRTMHEALRQRKPYSSTTPRSKINFKPSNKMKLHRKYEKPKLPEGTWKLRKHGGMEQFMRTSPLSPVRTAMFDNLNITLAKSIKKGYPSSKVNLETNGAAV